jgi:hypothetical protein
MVGIARLLFRIEALFFCEAHLDPRVDSITRSFERYTNNFGDIANHSRTLLALSHWSYQSSGGNIMVTDLQGIGYMLTDPQIHKASTSTNEVVSVFGDGDCRSQGMSAFFKVIESL